MTAEHDQFEQRLASLEDNLHTARAALSDGEYQTIRNLQFYRPLRWCLTTHPTSTRDTDVYTVVGQAHLLETEYLPQENDEAIKRCLEDFEQILEKLHQTGHPSV